MTDLSYTNKDGVNLYEGFDNGFNYHRDGAAEGDGYAHGGYPEITGETSPYTDTSYKTGDNPDFFDNGNVWEQPSVNPGPGPEPPEPTLERIEITTPPTKTDYFSFSWYGTLDEEEEQTLQNAAVDLAGLEVTAYYSDGNSEVITDYTTSPKDGDFIYSNSANLVVTYQDKQASMPLTIEVLNIEGNTLGPDDPECNDQEYVNISPFEVGESVLGVLVGARANPDSGPEWLPQYLYLSAEADPSSYVDINGTVYNIPAYESGGSDPANCVVLGPITYPEKGINIFTRQS